MSDYFRDRKFAPLPVYGGLWQAKHIYTKEHAEEVIRVSSLDTLDARYACLTVQLTPKGFGKF